MSALTDFIKVKSFRDECKIASDDDDWSDFDEDIGNDDYEDFTGDFTKRLNAARSNCVGPNRQTVVGAAELRSRALRSGEAQIQLHLDTNSGGKTHRRDRDRADRATVEQVLDPRTRLILFRLIQRGLFEVIFIYFPFALGTYRQSKVALALERRQMFITQLPRTKKAWR
jgi:hypothetical protein